MQSILEYSDEKISLNLGKVCVAFCGDSLTMSAFDGEQTVIRGKFLSIEFS